MKSLVVKRKIYWWYLYAYWWSFLGPIRIYDGRVYASAPNCFTRNKV